jgi:diadenosine tetraphosphate (Ap4A) HIT family hydrolase
LSKQDCLFCKFSKNEIPVVKVFEDQDIFVIADIAPQAPTHLLLIPKKHYENGAEVAQKDPQAAALGYAADTTKVDAKKFPKHAAAQKCNNCALYQGKATDASAGCPLFAGKLVHGNGWCSAYAKKA